MVNIFPLLGIKPGMVLADPACGRGDLAIILEQNGYTVKSSDIRNTGYGDPYINFLTITPEFDDEPYEVDALVTNPPFSLADEFIYHAVRVLKIPIVVMLLKTSFFNSQRGLRLYDKCPHSGVYPLTFRLAFLEEERGSSPLMDCNWYVWQAGNPRKCPRPLSRPDNVPALEYPMSVLKRDNEIARARNDILRRTALDAL